MVEFAMATTLAINRVNPVSPTTPQELVHGHVVRGNGMNKQCCLFSTKLTHLKRNIPAETDFVKQNTSGLLTAFR